MIACRLEWGARVTEPAPETIERETTKLWIPAPQRGSPDRHSRRGGYLPAMTSLARSGGDMRPQCDGGRRFQHGGGG